MNLKTDCFGITSIKKLIKACEFVGGSGHGSIEVGYACLEYFLLQ